MARRLTRAFFDRDPRVLAPDLLNKLLISTRDDERLVARIVEVEAYRGAVDPASHAYRGRTARNATMFGPPGRLYVYFTYGMHFCINVVAAAPEGDAGAVLIRAAVPLQGLELMRARRPAARQDRMLLAGPARLASAFGLVRDDDGRDLTRGPVTLADDGTPPPRSPGRSTRIGLAAGKGDDTPWRWFVAGDPHVSGPRARNAL
ncbi:MAG: DNA-3-methyladenine glycosylase [Acidimicrobiia bacterium]|nr:DNA-3-methyladenine glycosylase [Acidimicrobiia bacterium]